MNFEFKFGKFYIDINTINIGFKIRGRTSEGLFNYFSIHSCPIGFTFSCHHSHDEKYIKDYYTIDIGLFLFELRITYSFPNRKFKS